mmetsp:Transcript_31490/g.82276  ORF Transcript_31490/g.82276 Transcript_31490/m.82276 type:complete len:609 (+) Transcript_31490:75-1901(+)
MTDVIACGSITEAVLLAEWTPRVSIAAKDTGNIAFKAKDYKRAAEAYQLAIRCDSTNRSACSNLALMHLKMGEPDQAALAANTALVLSKDGGPDAVYWKARYRRGLAFEALGKLDYALVDLEDSGGIAEHDLKRVKAKILAERATQQSAQGEAAATVAESSGCSEHKERGKMKQTATGRGAGAAGGNEDCEDDEEDLISEVVDVTDRRLRRQQGDAVVATLPRIEDGPFAGRSREAQKAEMCGLISEAMDATDRGAFREALQLGGVVCMMSIMMGEAPAALLAFTILSSAHLGMHDFDAAMGYGDRAVQILQPRFDMSILNPTPTVREDSKGTLINGLRHPCSSYAPKTVLICEAFAYIATAMVHSRAMRMAEAIHDYKKAEAALRLLPPVAMARGMLATVLNNLGNNFSKNQNRDAAERYYAEAREVAASTGARGEEHARAIRLSQALMLHHKGQTAEAYKELVSIWSTATWEPDEMQSKRQTLLLLTNLSEGEEHFRWFTLFEELQSSLGFDRQATCAICLEPLAPQHVTPASPRVLISTCFHALHRSCWDGHKAAAHAGESVRCPVCRHEIIVATSPAVYNTETQELTPLRQGREEEDMRSSWSL